jgi:hypothetical protein
MCITAYIIVIFHVSQLLLWYMRYAMIHSVRTIRCDTQPIYHRDLEKSSADPRILLCIMSVSHVYRYVSRTYHTYLASIAWSCEAWYQTSDTQEIPLILTTEVSQNTQTHCDTQAPIYVVIPVIYHMIHAWYFATLSTTRYATIRNRYTTDTHPTCPASDTHMIRADTYHVCITCVSRVYHRIVISIPCITPGITRVSQVSLVYHDLCIAACIPGTWRYRGGTGDTQQCIGRGANTYHGNIGLVYHDVHVSVYQRVSRKKYHVSHVSSWYTRYTRDT